MVDFLNNGTIAGLRLGMPQQAVIDALGVPADWLGKPPVIGPVVIDPMQASIWNYYNAGIGVCFSPNCAVEAIIVRVPRVTPEEQPFLDWPSMSSWTIGDFVAWLNRHGVSYVRSRPDEIPGWLVICGRCLVSDVPKIRNNESLPYFEHNIASITAFKDPEAIDYTRRTGRWLWEKE